MFARNAVFCFVCNVSVCVCGNDELIVMVTKDNVNRFDGVLGCL